MTMISFILEIAFLNTNDFFSRGGSRFSLKLRQKDTKQPLLLNNSIQDWTYRHLKNGDLATPGSITLQLKTSFSSFDETKGLYEGLTLQSASELGSDGHFLLSTTIKQEFLLSDDESIAQSISLLGSILEVSYRVRFTNKDIKFKTNLGYISARFLTFWWMIYCMIFESLVSTSVFALLLIQFLELLMLAVFLGINGACRGIYDKEDLKEICPKKVPLVLLSGLLLYLLTINPVYYPMTIFVPLLMAFLDRLQSHGCQQLNFLMLSELSKFTLILVVCYVPGYIIPSLHNLLMDFNLYSICLYVLVGFVIIPGLFLIENLLSRKSVKQSKTVFYREELHGRGRDRPMLIQKGQGDILPTLCKLSSRETPHTYYNKKLWFHYPSSMPGIVEVEVIKTGEIRGITSIRVTGKINFYTYRRRTSEFGSSMPQQCQDLGYRPSYRFKTLNKLDPIYEVDVIPVETPEATSEQKFITIFVNSYGKSSKL